MPKLNPVDTLTRVKDRLDQLRAGKSIETRTLNKLLTDIQQQRMKKSLATRAGTGKTVRDIQIECFEIFVEELHESFDAELAEMQHEKNVRAAKIYLDAFFEAKSKDGNPHAVANAALQQHGFGRLDGNYQGRSLTKRDREVLDTEALLRKMIEAQLSDEEREEIEYWREQEREQKKNKKTK
jgi:hypothetical protein